MKAFTIHEPPEPPAERFDRAEALVFVKDGFSWPAFFFAPIWMLLNNLWLGLACYLVLAAGLAAGADFLGLGEDVTSLAFLVLHLLVGFEADRLQRWTLARKGWRELGAVTGRSRDECERSFFDAWLPDQPLIAPAKVGTSSLGNRIMNP